MSSTHSTANPELGDTSADTSGPRSSLFGKPIAVSATFAEQGLQAFSQEQGSSLSALLATRNARRDGGIPSSPAFAAEQAVDDQRFAALDLETRDQAVSLSSQMKRDFLLAQAAPTAPPGFATGPSNATRPISRSASMAGEVVDSPVEVPVDDGDATPLILANHKEVSKILHLAGPPTTKAGQKEKAEAPGAGAARANGNIIRIGGQFITLVGRVEKAERRAEGDARACQSRHRNNNVGKLEDKIELVGAQSRNAIENLESRIKLLATGASSDARVGLHTSQIAQLTDSLDTVKRALERLTSTFICDDDGVPIKQFATQGDIAGLWDSIQEGFDGHDAVVEERLAPTIQKVNGATSLVAKLEAAVAKLETHDTKREQQLLAARENIAGLRIDLAAALNASKPSGSVVTVAPAAAAAPPAEARSTGFSIGGKKLKRKASVELVTGPVKRANAKPDKGAFHHWTRVSPVNADAKNAPPLLFRKLLEAAAIKDYSLPAVYIERATGEPSVLNVGFTSVNDANSFVGAWSAANLQMPVGLRGITAQHMAVAGSAASNDVIAFLTGN
ncbi:hypothetical protein B0H13DRAFT_2097753 [Mycena leptocephala]|nr:hypothetical protein B0H13DRAFT_2097753 [Mycena leptocephala]